MTTSKDSRSSNSGNFYKSANSKQDKTCKSDTQAFNRRIQIWLDKNNIKNEERVAIIADVMNLHIKRNIDITAVGPITSLFLTHKEEAVPWKIFNAIIDMNFKDGIPQVRLYPMLAWKFEKKYPVTQRSYASRLRVGDLEELRKMYKTKVFKEIISKYQPPLHRALPDNMEHRKALEEQEVQTRQTHNIGHAQLNLPLRSTTSSSSANVMGHGNLLSPASTPTSTFSRTTSYIASSSPTSFNPSIKRERSPDPLVPSKRLHHLSEEKTYMHQHLNNEYTAQYAELTAEKAKRLAVVHRTRAKLDKEEAEIRIWFDREFNALEMKDARLRGDI